MSGKTRTPQVPRSVPKLEAELIADEYAALAARASAQATDSGMDTPRALSTDDQQRLRQRLLDLGISEESVESLAFDDSG
ncbi:hypothetical protein [Halomicrococcus sp. NG-SE-24]|uniref:hypothetical protein n=1 Tax=Halomicrococcus sp. NG-SE-24 TaxID=3436928 RepID=UPI003D95CB13